MRRDAERNAGPAAGAEHMISPVDPARRFYDALGRRDVAGGQDLLGEDAPAAFSFERNAEPTNVLGIRDLPDPVPGLESFLYAFVCRPFSQPTFGIFIRTLRLPKTLPYSRYIDFTLRVVRAL
jgi:hypothetical protein